MKMHREVRRVEQKQSETLLEENRLKKTIAIAEEQLLQARKATEEKKAEMIEAKKDVREDTAFAVMDLNSPDDFEAMVEMSQYNSLVNKIAADYEEEKRNILRLESLMRTPYFARLDFRFEGEETAEQIYIGRSPLTEKSTREIYVYDWRSPVAGVFYRFMTGRAFYDAPAGRVEGEVCLKRQYEIKDGQLQYFFDTDRNINDEILRRLLSKNASPKMKAIVETIQGEQDMVIRDMENDLLMVQGVAGSGKTSIALHRAAYLMYRGLQSRLSADSILILSPNSAFEEYISDVLPELGEASVASAVFDDILRKILIDRPIQSHAAFLELAVSNGRFSRIARDSMQFKMSECFQALLERLLEDIPLKWISFQDVVYEGTCVLTGEELRQWVLRRPETPLGMRLAQLENHVLEAIFGTGKKPGSGEEKALIRLELQRNLQFDLSELYARLFQDKAYFNALTERLNCAELIPESIEEIRTYTLENLRSDSLYYDDALALAYLFLRVYGFQKYRKIRQVVIDEAQDYYSLQYEMFRMLFPNAKFTVLGDINQTLAKQENLSLYHRIRRILNKKRASLITLDKSFRCTSEILNFSLQFLSAGGNAEAEIKSFNRSGDKPTVSAADTRKALLDNISHEIEVCREKGFASVCLLCKTAETAARLFEELRPKTSLRLIRDKNMEELQGVFAMPVYLSKGLEFDAVIICDADAQTYRSEDDRKLLYVECTRALHRLSLFCQGARSPLITEA